MGIIPKYHVNKLNVNKKNECPVLPKLYEINKKKKYIITI